MLRATLTACSRMGFARTPKQTPMLHLAGINCRSRTDSLFLLNNSRKLVLANQNNYNMFQRREFSSSTLPHSTFLTDMPLSDWTCEDANAFLRTRFVKRNLEPLFQLKLSGADFYKAVNENSTASLFPAVFDNQLAADVLHQLKEVIQAQEPHRSFDTIIVDERIKHVAKEHLDRSRVLMAKSRDLAYQQREQKLLKAPLPFAFKDKPSTINETFFYTDVRQTSYFKDFENEVRASLLGPQNSRIINLVQTSGFGKTHLVMQHALQHGGLVVCFDKLQAPILDVAVEVLEQQYSQNCSLFGPVGSFATEKRWTNYGKQVMALIPLTFLQYAEHFYEAANGMSDAEKHEAFQLAIASDASQFIVEMYKVNLKKISFDAQPSSYNEFKQKMIEVAHNLKLKVFHYDEVHHLDTKMKGMFMHLTADDKEDQALARLRKERVQKDYKADEGYDRATSLLYCLILAIEDFIHDALPQVVMTAKYSAADIAQCEPSRREAILVHNFLLSQDIKDSVKRFKKLATDAFGTEISEELSKYDKELYELASRADYLFGSFPLFRKIEANSLKDLTREFIMAATERASEQATKYVQAALMEGLKEAAPFLRVALGCKQVELSTFAAEALVASGSIKLTEPFLDHRAEKVRSEKVIHLFDPFVCTKISKQSGESMFVL